LQRNGRSMLKAPHQMISLTRNMDNGLHGGFAISSNQFAGGGHTVIRDRVSGSISIKHPLNLVGIGCFRERQ
jgi:hypothetical protein